MDKIVAIEGGQFGILSQPAQESRPDICLLLLNAGFIHRSGPSRLHTRLARRLATQGIASFRIDAPGVGDSIARTDVPLVQTVRNTMDHLQAGYGYARFVVGGLCSAADLGWQVALADARVAGVLSIDGLARKGWWHRFAQLRRALRKPPQRWLRALNRRAMKRTTLRMSDADLRDWPAAGDERKQFAELVGRGVELFFLFSGGSNYFLHPRQFRETFGISADASLVAFHYWPHCDHTFFAESDRLRLIDTLTDWMVGRFRR